MAEALQGPTLVRKGPQDGISAGGRTITCAAEGSKRRAGGQVSLNLDLHVAQGKKSVLPPASVAVAPSRGSCGLGR